MKQTKQAFWIMYVFFLIAFILSFWVIILNKQSFFEKSLEFTKLQEILSKNILTQATVSFHSHEQNNKNNSWYRPILSCPEEVLYLSWTEIIATGKTMFENNSCSWSLFSQPLLLFFNETYDTFSSGTLWWTGFELSWINNLTWSFSQYKISFEKPNIFDERFIQARTQIEGIIWRGNGYQNIFWSNSKIKNFLQQNINNTWSLEFIGNITSWVLYFGVNDSFSGKIVQFNKTIFDTQNKLLKTSEWNFSNSWWVVKSFLQDDLSFSWNIWTPKLFDFEKNDYAIFLSYNTWSLHNIHYTFKVFSNNGTWVYINPIKDNITPWKYLWNNIFLQDGQFYNKIEIINNY